MKDFGDFIGEKIKHIETITVELTGNDLKYCEVIVFTFESGRQINLRTVEEYDHEESNTILRIIDEDTFLKAWPNALPDPMSRREWGTK